MRILASRCLLALMLAAASLVLMATPAAAVPYTFSAFGGSFGVTATNDDHLDFPLWSPGCPASTVDVDFTGDATSGILTVLDVDLHATDTVLGGDYYMHITDTTDLGDSQTGIYDDWSIGLLDVGLRATIYESDVEDCIADELVCTFVFDLGMTGSYMGTAPSGVVFGSLLGSSGAYGLMPDTGCDAPFHTYIDGIVNSFFLTLS